MGMRTMTYQNKKNSARRAKIEKSEARFNKLFLIACAAIALLTLGRVAYHQYYTDYSISLEAVDRELLVKPHSYVSGPDSAKVTIVEFMDPQCRACRSMHSVLKSLKKEFTQDIRVVTRYSPFHDYSLSAIAILEEAREMGKFDEALDAIFEKQHIWDDKRNPRPELLPEILTEIGIGKSQISVDQLIAKHRWKVDLDDADRKKLGLTKSPTFFVNGRIVRSLSYESMKKAIEGALEVIELNPKKENS